MKFEVTKEENAVEEYFCKPFNKLKRHEMGIETTRLMYILLAGDPAHKIKESDKPWLFKIIEQRIHGCLTMKISDERLLLFITHLAETPGNAVMYLAYLQYRCKKEDIKELSFEYFCESIFPFGFPSDEDLHQLWNAQKVRPEGGSDNLLDYQTAYKSIQF